jgi:hypothetical protein
VRACVLVAVEMPFSSTFSAFAGATQMQGWKVAQELALFALFKVAGRGIGSRGHEKKIERDGRCLRQKMNSWRTATSITCDGNVR